MADDTRTLNLAIKADIEVARTQLEALVGVIGRTATEVDTKLSAIEAKISGLGGVMQGFVGGLAAGLVEGIPEIGEKLWEASKKALEFANTIKEVSERTGVSTDFLQTYRLAALDVGASAEVADKSLDHFNKVLGDAQGGNLRALAAFRAIPGVTREMVDGWRNSEAAMRGVATGFAGIGEEAQRSAVIQRLYGEGSAALIPVLEQGAAGFDRIAEAAKGLGIVLGPEQIENAHKAEIQFDRIKTVLDNQFANAVTSNADAVLELGKAFIWAGNAAGNAILQMRGARAMTLRPGGGTDVLLASGETLAAMGTPQGQLDYDNANVARLERQLRDTGFGGRRRDDIAAQLATAKGYQADSRDQLLNTGQFGTNFVDGLGAKPGNGVIHERAAAVIERLQGKVAAGGDKRQLSINAELLAAGFGIGDTSDQAKQIIALAGKAYDDGPGATAAAAAARKETAEARAAEAARLAAAKRFETGERDVDTAQRGARDAAAAATFDPAARYAAETQNLADSHRDRLSTIAAEGPGGTRKYTEAQQAKLREAEDQAYLAKQITAAAKEEDRIAQEALALQATDLDGQQSVLQDRLSLAQTANERRSIELDLLDLADRQQRAQLQGVIASELTTATERAIAQKKLDQLAATHADRVEGVNRGTQGPLESYLQSLPDTADKITESLQKVQVEGLKGIEDGLIGIVTGTETAGQAFGKMADMIISDLIRIGVERSIIGPIANALFGGSGGGGGALAHLLGFADGGDPPTGTPYMVGERGPELRIDRSPGTIIPNHKLGSGGSNISVSVDARGSADPAAVQRQVFAGIFAAAPAIVAASKGETMTDMRRPKLPGGFG